MEQVTIRPLDMDDWELATALIWRVFLRCNAADYEQEGIKSFLNFISDEHLKMFCKMDEFEMLGAYMGQRLAAAGMIRGGCHISLLFVDTAYQRQGIGKKLVDHMSDMIMTRGGGSVSVNATPFAKEFYLKQGFTQTEGEQIKEGVRYFPMVKLLGNR